MKASAASATPPSSAASPSPKPSPAGSPNQRIEFTIRANTGQIPPTTLDEHVTVGGRFFDVLTGEYDLRPLPNGDTFLHLSSRERLSTDFNRYAALWSDAVMHDLQSNILYVIRNRCEQTSISELVIPAGNLRLASATPSTSRQPNPVKPPTIHNRP